MSAEVKAMESTGPPAALGPVSVVVVNYNGAEHLPHCLDAVFAQTLAADEVLIVDNASSDGSERLARERQPSARVIRLPANHGPCPARNLGLSTARNRWVLLLDNDAVLLPETLEQMVRAAELHPDAAILQPRSVFAGEPSRVHYDGGALHYVGLFSLRNFFVPLAQAQGENTIAADGVVSVALLLQRELILAVGGFDPAFFILFEDLDLSLRLRMRGHSLLSVENAIVHHRGGTPGISFRSGPNYPDQRAFFHARNRWFVLLKNYSWRTLFVALPGLAVYEFVWFCFTLTNGSVWAHIRGRWALFLALPRTLRQRGEIQRARLLPDRDLLVGGPLTITPSLKSAGLRNTVLRALDWTLTAWWSLVRGLAG